MDGDLDGAALLDRGDGVGGEGVLGLLTNVDVAGQLGAAALVDDVGLDLGVAD
jgi:hypothetical protein